MPVTKKETNETHKESLMKKPLEKLSKSELIKEYISLKRDYEFIISANREFARLLGIYKEGYFRYREYLRQVAEFIVGKGLENEFKDIQIILNPDDKPMIKLYDESAPPVDAKFLKENK